MMMNKPLILILFLFIITGTAGGQDNEFSLWSGFTGKHDFNKHLEAELALVMRTTGNMAAIDQYFAEGGLTWQFNDFVSCGASYRLTNKLEDDSKYHFRQKFYFNIKGTLPAGKFSFSGRMMYQNAVRSYIEDENDPISEHNARLKLKATYNPNTTPFKPFISYESFIPVAAGKGFNIEKSRSAAGTEIRISRNNSFELSYIFENYSKIGKTDKHILSLNYELKF
jgi:hypothetical protein